MQILKLISTFKVLLSDLAVLVCHETTLVLSALNLPLELFSLFLSFGHEFDHNQIQSVRLVTGSKNRLRVFPGQQQQQQQQ